MHRLVELQNKIDQLTSITDRDLLELLKGYIDMRKFFQDSGDIIVSNWLMYKIISVENIIFARTYI